MLGALSTDQTSREGSPLVEPVRVGRHDGSQAVRRVRGGLDAQRLLRGQEDAGSAPQRQHGAPEHGPAQQAGQPSELLSTWEIEGAVVKCSERCTSPPPDP